MSKISIYEVVPVPKLADKLVGTSVGGDPEDITYNFTLSDLLNLFIPNIPGNTLQGVLDFGNTATQNINLTGIITTTTLNVGSTANILNSNLTGQTKITGGLYDRLNSIGTAGQVLTSTGTQVEWYTIPTVIPDLQQVLTSGNTAVNNIILTGNLSANNAALLTSTISTSLTVLGTLRDGLSSVGTNNQVLSSNVTGVRWVNLPVYSATSPLLYNSGTGVFSIQQANASQNGYLSSADWITFDGKQTAISLTTTGNSGASTLVGATINVPNYTLSGLGGVPQTRTLTINGVTFNLSADRTWTLATGVSSVSATTPLFSTGGANPDISIQQSSSSLDGYLSSTDWLTFNSKQPAGNYITSLTGEATAAGPGAASVILSNAAVIGKLLTGLSITGSAISSSDSILTAFGKVQNQINGLIGGVQFQGVWNAATNTPALVSSVGTQGYYYIVDVAGNTNLNGITDWQVGDWAIFNGSTWNKVDNTDLVTSVNGQIGAVSLTTDNIPEGATNLYYLDSRARAALSFAAGSGAYNSTTGVITIPTDNSQILNGAGYITLVSLSATSPLTYNNTTGAFAIQVANTTQDGYLSSTDWNTFNGKQPFLGGTGLVKSVAGVISYITDNSANWNTAYNDSIVSAAVTGTVTKTLTLNQQDGGTITASWSDIDTGLTSVGVSMPSAFTVTNSPLTSNGTIAITGSGNTLQYVDGTGALQSFPSLTGYVPYTGATANVNLGIYNLTAASLIKNGGTSGQFLKADGSVDSSAYIVLGSLSATAPLSYNNTTGVFTISQSGASTNGYLSSTDWNTFNSKEPAITAGTTLQYYRGDKTFQTLNTTVVPEGTNLYYLDSRARTAISLTTTGSSGAATYNNTTGVFNIPDYGSALSGYVPTSRQLSINGTQYDLSADRSWSVGTVTTVSFTLGASGTDLNSSVTNSTTTPSITLNVPTASAANRGALSAADWSTFNTKVGGVTATSPLFSSGGSTPNLTIQQSSGSQAGFLSAADWTTFNNKQAAGNYITSLTGEATASGPGAAAVTLNNASVTGKVLTGVNITGGTILATDSILTGFGKLQNQVNGLIGGSIYQGTWNAATNTPTLTSSVGTAGYYYIVSVAGTTNLNGITDWQVGDWAIFNGGVWQKVDNTDSVISVNGQTGVVSLTTDNIPEGTTNLYFLNSRARSALSFVAGSGAYNSTTGVITIPTNNNQITNGSNYITLGSLSGTAPISYNSGTGAISITQSGTASNGFLSSTDWNTFNNKQATISLTTTGTSGAATLVGATLNIPNYGSALTGYVPYTGATANVDLGGFNITAGGTSSFVAATLTSNLWLKNTGTYDFIISNNTSLTTNTVRAYYTTTDELRFYAKNTAGASVVPKIMVGDGTTFTQLGTGTVTSVAANAGTGISITGSPITTAGTFCITNTAPYSGEAVIVLGAGTLSSVRCGVTNTSSGAYSAALGGRVNIASGNCSFVGGGASNTATGVWSTTVGGSDNCATSPRAFVGGGYNNSASGAYSTVSGGYVNRATGGRSFVGGGTSNCASGANSTASGGFTNTASGNCATVAGGGNNLASGIFSTVAGGSSNTSNNTRAFVGGGISNTASAYNTTVGGGYINSATAGGATVAGGITNTASGTCSTVGGGCGNTASSNFTTVGGGVCNTASSYANTIGGGFYNYSVGNYNTISAGYKNCIFSTGSFIGGGTCNYICNGLAFSCTSSATIAGGAGGNTSGGTFNPVNGYFSVAPTAFYAAGQFSTIGGGFQNRATDYTDVVSGGFCNIACGGFGAVGGGRLNTASGTRANISGGETNTASNSWTFVGGGLTNSASGGYAIVGGGRVNTASGSDSVATGGRSNTASGACSFIGSGCGNTASSGESIVVGGKGNIASGVGSFVGGGCANTASYYQATVAGGWANTASGYRSAITGGQANAASGNYSFIGGGISNVSSSNQTVVGGGNSNSASADRATVSGGISNIASGNCSVVAGGKNNTASNAYTFVGGGNYSIACGVSATASGGYASHAYGNYSTVGGGCGNNALSACSTVAGGRGNTASFAGAAIVGGQLNTASYYFSFVGAGNSNIANNYASAVAGGSSNTASGYRSFVGAGISNTASGNCSVVAGGSTNIASGAMSSIAGGSDNFATSNRAAVGGGYNNTASSTYSTVSGGYVNRATGGRSFVGGGTSNCASGSNSTISGGCCNTASAAHSTIAGGRVGTASGAYSSIGGGLGNEAAGNGGSTVSGGYQNQSLGLSSTIGGGCKNYANAFGGFIGGGNCNNVYNPTSGCLAYGAVVVGGVGNNTSGGTWSLAACSFTAAPTFSAAGQYSFIGGGFQNRATALYGTVGGGVFNCATNQGAFVGGGCNNMATGYESTIGGGYNNCATTYRATVGGGWTNTASGSYSVTAGGRENNSTGTYSTVGGGFVVNATGGRAFAGGGQSNTASGYASVLTGGRASTASGDYAFIGGGKTNAASGGVGVVGGGCGNIASGNCSFVGGGCGNSAVSLGSFVGGGSVNTACGPYKAAVVGGGSNTASGYYSFIGAGYNNLICGVYASTISGGYQNRIYTGCHGFIGGGRANAISGVWGAIAGGCTNTITSAYNFIGGGQTNTASGTASVVAGGISNTASGACSFAVGGGSVASGCTSIAMGGSTASAYRSVAIGAGGGAGGQSATGNYSATIGGSNKTVSGSYSFAGGGYSLQVSGAHSAAFGCDIIASVSRTTYSNNFCACSCINAASRGTFLGAVDNALFSLNSGGTLYTVGFSPTASANSSTTFTITTGTTTWIYTGGGAATWTLPNPSGTNQIFWIKNAGTGAITLNAFSGTNIINNSAASVSSISIAVGATAVIAQDGNVKSYQLQ